MRRLPRSGLASESDLLFAYGTLMRGLALHHLIEGREVRAWTYWFNGLIGDAVPVPDGNYRQHLTARTP